MMAAAIAFTFARVTSARARRRASSATTCGSGPTSSALRNSAGTSPPPWTPMREAWRARDAPTYSLYQYSLADSFGERATCKSTQSAVTPCAVYGVMARVDTTGSWHRRTSERSERCVFQSHLKEEWQDDGSSRNRSGLPGMGPSAYSKKTQKASF